MSNIQSRTISYRTFIGHIHKAMLTVMDSGDGYFEGKINYDPEKRTLEVTGEDFLDFQTYIEALIGDGVPATDMNGEGTLVPSLRNQNELTGFLQEVVRKMESPLIVGRQYGTTYGIRLIAEQSVSVKFQVHGHTDSDAPFGFSASIVLPL